jgi:hypothetical protein
LSDDNLEMVVEAMRELREEKDVEVILANVGKV